MLLTWLSSVWGGMGGISGSTSASTTTGRSEANAWSQAPLMSSGFSMRSPRRPIDSRERGVVDRRE